MKLNSLPRNHAFTLLEIMLVVAIITLLLSTGFWMIGNKFKIGQDAKIRADLQSFDSNLKIYEMNNGFFPTTEQGLQALVVMPTTEPKPKNWINLTERLVQDPYQRDYVYLCPGKHNPQSYDLYSKGKDGIAETADDQGNWDPPQTK